MPQLKNSDDFKSYGTTNYEPALLFMQRLEKRFAPHEWVRVINIDNEPVYWQYMPVHNETVEFDTGSVPMKHTYRENPEAWVLNPGESEILIGANAYLMIDNLYKKLIAKGYIKKNGEFTPGTAGRNFNWSDPKTQEDLIDKIFLGKENPSFGNAKPAAKVPETPRLTTTSGRLRTA